MTPLKVRRGDILTAAYNSVAKKILKGWFLVSGDTYPPSLFHHLLGMGFVDSENDHFHFFKDVGEFYEYKKNIVKKYFPDYFQTLRNQDLVLSGQRSEQSFFKHDEMTAQELVDKHLEAGREVLELAKDLEEIERHYLSTLTANEKLRLTSVPVMKTKGNTYKSSRRKARAIA